MNRIAISPRYDWQSKVVEVGLTFHTPEGQPYWDESVYYQLTSSEVDTLEKAANDLHMMCIEAAQKVIDENRFADGKNPPKMLEYNADTPTAPLPPAVAQWYWLQEVSPRSDQFNSIHEKLMAAWKQFGARNALTVYLGGVKDCLEDQQTVLYIQDTCHQAGLSSAQLFVEDLGYDPEKRSFVDLDDQPVRNFFKLYPWEWMWREPFAPYLKFEPCNFIEPMWKMLLSNKGLLPVLWELFPKHPNLLPAFFSEEELAACPMAAVSQSGFIKKPKLSREGANVSICRPGEPVQTTEGDYGQEGYVYQAMAPDAPFDGNYPVMGVWIVNHEACGLGIREDTSRITGNLSRFVPHLF